MPDFARKYSLQEFHRDLATVSILVLRKQIHFDRLPREAYSAFEGLKEMRMINEVTILLFGPLLESEAVSEDTLLEIIRRDHGQCAFEGMAEFYQEVRKRWVELLPPREEMKF